MIVCPRCGAGLGEPCCGGVKQLRFFQCERCNSVVPNVRWNRVSVIDGYTELAMRCTGCEEQIPFKEWVFKRDDGGVGEYSCPRCNKVWSRG